MKMAPYSSFAVVHRLGRSAWALAATALVSQFVQGVEITQYGIGKYRRYEQTAPAPGTPPALASFGFYSYGYESAQDAVVFGTVTGPSGQPSFLANNANDPKLLEADEGQSSQSDLDTARPNGNYFFQFFTATGGTINTQLGLTGDAYPNAPALANFAAAQDIDRTQAFVLQWTKPPQLDATDYVTVLVRADGELIYSTPFPWQPGVLAGTTISASLPPNTLPATGNLEAEIDFINVTVQDTQQLAGATGIASYAARTTFPLKIHGGGGGGDTTPPTLVIVSPSSGASGVSTTSPVVFVFSEAMKPQQQIQWFGPPNPASFQYAWSGDAKSLICTYPGGFPASTSIAWQLQASAFADLAGNTLTGNNLAGTFTTASSGGGPGPCTNSTPGRVNSFFIGRMANYDQTSSAAPVPASGGVDNPAATFLASLSTTNSNVSGADVVIPSGQTKTLVSQFGHYFYFESFPTEAALTAAYPNGSYLAEVTMNGGGKSTSTVALANGPNTPHNSNFDPAQMINPAAAFTLSWDALANPTANDRIAIIIFNDQGMIVLQLPDECATPPKPLAVTATSITIPANLLQMAKTYTVDLTFSRVSDIKSNAPPAYITSGGFFKTTHFNIKTIGAGTPNSTPVITGYRIAPDGRFEVDVMGAVGHTLKLEASDLSSAWSTAGSATVPVSGKITVRDSRLANLGSQAYRVKSE